jgi:hypothetical protein
MPRRRSHCAGRSDRSVDEQFARVERKLDSIRRAVSKLEGVLMTKAEDIKASVAALTVAFKEATDELAKDLESLREQVKTGLEGGLTADEATELQADIDSQLGAAKDRLVELGKDPSNPVPEA